MQQLWHTDRLEQEKLILWKVYLKITMKKEELYLDV
jgi:hypothetical protein